MKTVIILSICTLACVATFAQENYHSLKNIFQEQLNRHAQDTNFIYAEKLLSHFEIATKPDTIVGYHYGIGIVVPENEPIYLLPAIYSIQENRYDKKNLRGSLEVYYDKNKEDIYYDREDAKPTKQTADFVNAFLNNNKLFATRFYQRIRGAAGSYYYGGFSENETEFVFNDEASLYFFRKSDGWLFAVSIDAEYSSLARSRMIFYAFRLSNSATDIFMNK